MATYTAQATVEAQVTQEPSGDMVEHFALSVDVLKDGVVIGSFQRNYGVTVTNQEIRIDVEGAIRDIVEGELIGTAQAALDIRANAIETAINTWQKVLN